MTDGPVASLSKSSNLSIGLLIALIMIALPILGGVFKIYDQMKDGQAITSGLAIEVRNNSSEISALSMKVDRKMDLYQNELTKLRLEFERELGKRGGGTDDK